MAYTLNSVDLYTAYGFVAGQAPEGNIALTGCFDLPARIGKTFHSWDDQDSIEPYVAEDDLTFGGRDLALHGLIIGENQTCREKIKLLEKAIKALMGLVTLSTPYGDFSVYIKPINYTEYNGVYSVVMNFREPVVILTAGTLPAVAENLYTIDSIPLSSFGLYVSKKECADLPELKSQQFTKYRSEGYQITKRDHPKAEITGFIKATSLADFQAKIKNLYLIFSSSGTRYIILNNQIEINCFAAEGFKISGIMVLSNFVLANFKISLMAVNVNYISELSDEDGVLITDESGVQILI